MIGAKILGPKFPFRGVGWNFGPQGGCQALRGAEVENIVTTTVEFRPMMIMKQI